MKAQVTGEEDGVLGDDDLYSISYEEPEGQVRQNKSKKQKSHFDQFGDNEVIKECDLKKKGVKAKITKSYNGKEDTKNPQPFYLKLTPLIVNLIRTQMHERMIDMFEATVDLTASYEDVFVDNMQERYEKMSSMSIILAKYSTANNIGITVPKTEVFNNQDNEKEKVKVMVTADVNSWMHKYKETFMIELSDIFSAFVLESVTHFKNVDSDTKRNCDAYLKIFFDHVDKKIEGMTAIPEPIKKLITPYLKILAAMNVAQKTEIIDDEFKLTVSRRNRHSNGIFDKKSSTTGIKND